MLEGTDRSELLQAAAVPWSSKELQPLTPDLNIAASEEFQLTKIIRLQTKVGVCHDFCMWTVQLQHSSELFLRRAKSSLVPTCDRKCFSFWFSDEEKKKPVKGNRPFPVKSFIKI